MSLFNDFFGKEEAEKYKDIIKEKLSGQIISKRKIDSS